MTRSLFRRAPKTARSRPRRWRAWPAAGLSAVLCVLGLILLPGGSVSAASDVGGQITANEVMQRAADWYDLAPGYSQSSYSWDLGHTRQYRQDCSGFVDMALHLGIDYNTDGIAGSSLFTDVGAAGSSLTTADVRPGDVFDDTIDGHAFLFEGWAADGVHISYYNFGGGSSGTAPPEYHSGETFSQSYVGGEPTSHYRIYRYQNMVYSDASNSGVTVGGAGRQHIFVTTSTGAVAQRYDTSDGWSWDSIDGTVLVGSPAVNYYVDTNEYDVYATGRNGYLYVKEYRNGAWAGYWSIIDGPSLSPGVSAMIDKGGHQHVFASGTNGAVYNIRNTFTGRDGKNGNWTFDNIGGSVLTGTPGVNYFASTGEYDVYATGINGHLYEKDYINGNWAASWTDRGDHNLAGGAAAMVDKGGHQHVFAVTTAGSVVNARNISGGTWTWDDLGGTVLTSTPKLLYDYDSNTYNVWAASTNGTLYHKEYVNGAWWPTYHNFSGTTSINATG